MEVPSSNLCSFLTWTVQQKGKLIIELQEVKWQSTPLQSDCSLHINWWGETAADNLILVIPNGVCPPAITAVYPLLSSMKQFSRYVQDMGTLDITLVVGKHDTSGGEARVSLGNFSLEVANLSEDVQIQGSHAVFDRTGIFLAMVSIKVSLSYSLNEADAKGTDWNGSSNQLGKSFDDLEAQRLNLLREKDGRQQQSTALPNAVSKTEDIGRSLTAQVRSSFARAVAKGYDNFGQRKGMIMDIELSPRDQPSSWDSMDSLQCGISPKKQMVMDFEVRNPPTDVTLPKGKDRIAQGMQLVVDVNVPSADRGHLLSPKNVEQVSIRKQLVMDIDVPQRDRGHPQFPFDAKSPRIALLESDLLAEDCTKISHAEHPPEADSNHQINTSSVKGTASSAKPRGKKLNVSRNRRIQYSGRSEASRATPGENGVTTQSKSRPLSAPAGIKTDGNSSRPTSPSRVPRGKQRASQQEREGETTGLNSSPVAARPRFVGLPQGKQSKGVKPVSRSGGKSPLSDSELSIRRHEGQYSSASPKKQRPISYSHMTLSLNKGPSKFSSQFTKDTQEPSLKIETGRLPSPKAQRLGLHSSEKKCMSPVKGNAGPVKLTRAYTPSRSRSDRDRSKTPLKQTPFASGQTSAKLTSADELELKLQEEAKSSCEVHNRSPESTQMLPATLRVSLQRSSPRKSGSKTKAAKTAKPGQECDIHSTQELKSGWHELAGNLAILPGDDPCSPNIGESKSEEVFPAESLERLIERLEAFQQVLQKASSAAHIVDPEGNKALDLSERLRDVNEKISNISRHLTRMLPNHQVDDDDKPKYARVATLTEELAAEHGTETKDPGLCFRSNTIEEPRQCKDADRLKQPSDVCELHCDRFKQAPPMDIFLPSEGISNFNNELKKMKNEFNPTSGSRTPVLHDCCNVHRDSQLDTEKSPELNLRLTLTVGKLTFEELTLRDLGIGNASVKLTENAFGSSVIQNSSCLLTVAVPGLVHPTHTGAEQSLSISPVSLSWKEAHFGHKSQLHWSGLRGDALKHWVTQAMIVTASLSWDAGNSLVCEGRVFLGPVIASMPNCYNTKLELQKVRNLDSKSLYTCEPTGTPETPATAAKIDIGITLHMEDMSGKPEMMGDWLYVSIRSITGCIPQLKELERIGHLHLVVRTDNEDRHHIPFLAESSTESGEGGVETWRLCKRRHADAVLRAAKQLGNATLFIEVWQDWRGQDSQKTFASHYFIGLVEVPLTCQPTLSVGTIVPGPDVKSSQGLRKKRLSFHSRVEDQCVVVAEGNFSMWNPLKDVICGSLGLRAVLGSEAQMLNLQKRERAARFIQSYVRCFAERIHVGKKECVLFAKKHNRFADQQFPEHYNGGVTRHVLEVTVQHATDLPPNESFKGADSAPCEGAFIKYLFPCDGEPFYTQDMRWGRSISFNASVHHGIILPTSESLEAHLMKMRTFSKNDGNFQFELWGCFSDDLDRQTYLPNKLRLSDSGEPTSWDMRRKKYVISVQKLPRERFLGACKLSQKNLLHMISEQRRSIYSSPEVRKKFYLPVQMDQSQFQTYKRAPTLVVQVAYFILEIEDRKAHMVDTIFSGSRLREDSLLEATLEINIIRATGLESAVHEVERHSREFSPPFENGLNSYVRYSLFPSNRHLELIYPPATTFIKANDFAPQYRWTGELKIILNVQVLRELRTGNMCFEVWHHSYSHARIKLRPMVLSEESSVTDICLGVATIPSRILVQSKQGITGWHDLSRKGVVVGTVKLAVSFKTWRVRPL